MKKEDNLQIFLPSISVFFPSPCLLFLHILLSSINQSLAPLEGDMYYLVLRPLLEFFFFSSPFCLCGVCSMPSRWRNALIMISIIVFGIMVKKKKTKEKCDVECCTDSSRDVVFLFCFGFLFLFFCFLREHKLERWPLRLLPLADGNKIAGQSLYCRQWSCHYEILMETK